MIRLSAIALLLCCLDLGQTGNSEEAVSLRSKRKVPDPNDKRINCYYTNWSPYRTGDSKFGPDDIHPHICTHIFYAFAGLERDTGLVPFEGYGLVPFDPNQDIQLDGYKKFLNLKNSNPDLQLILSVGGSKLGSAAFSKMAVDSHLRSQFAKNSRRFLEQFGFDGLDLVWQYPNFTEGSSFSDKDNYVQLVKDLRAELKDEYTISMVVPSLAPLIQRGFDLPELSKYVDFMNIVTYDYHVATEAAVGHIAPLFAVPEDPFKDLNVDSTITAYTSYGVEPSKLNLGIPLYGVFFTLEDPEETDIGAGTEDEGEGTQERGAVIYNNFCKKIKEENWTIRHVNKSAMGPYAYKGTSWVSYDDEEMIKTKARYAVEKKLGGLMFWSMDMDDFKGVCHSRAFPLIKAGRDTFLAKARPNSSTSGRPQAPDPSSTKATLRTTPTTPITRSTQNTPRSVQTKPTPPSTRAPRPPTQPPSAEDTNPDTFDISSNGFPAIPKNSTIISNRDIIFQNIKIWITNHYYGPQN